MGQANSRQEEFWEACGFGRPHIVRHMINEGIDVNWRSFTHDCCPIHVASQGKPEIVKLLLDAKCDINVKDIRDNTALHHAAMRGHADIMDTLIKAGIDRDAQDKNGWTALHNASYWCHPEAVRVLIKNGCNVHLTNKDNRSALHETARSKETDDRKLGDIARQLVDAGSDINAKGSDLGGVDFTCLMFSAYHGHPEVATCLLEAGCDVNASGSNKWTSLHWATDREQEELVYILLDAGANPTKKGTRGELAADRAKTDEMKEVLMNAVNMFQELQELEKQKTPASPSRLSRISYSSMCSLNHSPTKTGPHGLVEEGQFSPPRSPIKHTDLSDLIDKINRKSGKLKDVTRHDRDEGKGDHPVSPKVSPLEEKIIDGTDGIKSQEADISLEINDVMANEITANEENDLADKMKSVSVEGDAAKEQEADGHTDNQETVETPPATDSPLNKDLKANHDPKSDVSETTKPVTDKADGDAPPETKTETTI